MEHRETVYIYILCLSHSGKLSLRCSFQIFFFLNDSLFFSVCGGSREGTVCFSVYISLMCLPPNK